jgi:hypothetical protein
MTPEANAIDLLNAIGVGVRLGKRIGRAPRIVDEAARHVTNQAKRTSWFFEGEEESDILLDL